jgi:hypothetical protein
MTDKIAFRPIGRAPEKITRTINYTCSQEQHDILEATAEKFGITIRELLRQMVDFALANMEADQE